MTPEEYLLIRDTQRWKIQNAEEIIARARLQAKRAKPPKYKLRPATPDDIRVNQILWRETTYLDNRTIWYWNIVEEVLDPSSKFKAYLAEDGCRYGLDCAWVRK